MQHTGFWAEASAMNAVAFSESDRGQFVDRFVLSIHLFPWYICIYITSIVRVMYFILAYRAE